MASSPARAEDLKSLIYYGEDVPGMPGVPITFVSGDTLGPAGHALVSVNFTNPADSMTDSAVVMVAPGGGSAETLLKSGDSVPGGQGVVTSPRGYALSEAGEVLLNVNVDVSGNSRQAWVAGTPGNLATILQRGQSLPDFAPGATASTEIFDEFSIGMNRRGEIAFLTKVYNGSPFGSPIGFGVWKGTSGGMTLELRTGTHYPGMPTGAFLTSIEDVWINDDGLLAFVGLIKDGSNYQSGIWTYQGGAVTPVLLSGNSAVASNMPSGQTWSGSFVIHSFANNGWIAFSATASGNEGGLFVAQGTSVSRVTRDHSSIAGIAPGTGGAEFNIRTTSPGFTATYFKISSSGRAVLTADLVAGTGSPAVNNSNNRGIWIWNGSGLTLLLREGDPAPGYTGGQNLLAIGSARFSQEGRLHFDSTALNSSSTSIWSENDAGGFDITAEMNQTVDNPEAGNSLVDSVAFAVISSVVGAGNSVDGRPTAVNALGGVLIRSSEVNSPRRAFIAVADAGTLNIPGSISGRVRFDTDGDGDPTDADSGVPDLTVELYLDNGQGLSTGPVIAETMTAGDGSFSFGGVNPGDYVMLVSASSDMLAANHIWTLPEGLPAGILAPVTVEPGLASPTVEVLSTNPVDATGIVTEDTNNDTTGDLPLEGATVELVRVSDDQTIATAISGPDGVFHFSQVRPGLYAMRETDLPDYISIEDSEGDPNDNLIFIALTSGVVPPQQEFVDRNDSNFIVSLRGLVAPPDTKTVTQESFGLGLVDPGLPLILRPDYNLLDISPIVAKGLVADGVTPLLIGLKSQIPLSEEKTLEWRVEISGGEIAGGIYPKMKVWESGTFWRPSITPTPESPNTITVSAGPAGRSGFLQIGALQPWDLVFAGQTELRLVLSFHEVGKTLPATSRTILIRRPPIGIISDLGAGEIGAGFRAQLELSRPSEFIVPLDSAEVGPQSFERFRNDWSFVQGDIIGHGRGGILAMQASGQSESNFFRGGFRRMVGVGVPHNGSLLHTYLGLMEGRLRSVDSVEPTTHYLPASIARVALWDDLRHQGDDAEALLTLDPLSPFFQEKPFSGVPRSLESSLTGLLPFSIHHIATRIDPEQSLVLKQLGLGFRTPYPSAATGLYKFVATSDGLVDLASQTAGLRDSGEEDFLTLRPYNSRLSEIDLDHPAHGDPAIIFGGSTTQLQSQEIARRSVEWLDHPLSIRADGIYRAPKPLSSQILKTIELLISQRTRDTIIDILPLLSSASFKVASSNEGAAPLAVTEYRFEIQPPVEAPVMGSINWFAEIHGPDGPSTLGVSVAPDAVDPLKVTVSVAEGLVGDVMIYVSYETTNDQIVYGRPDIVVSLPPDGETLIGIDLQPETLNLPIGRSIEPDIMAVYSQGTRLRRVVAATDLGAVSSSNPAVLDVSNPLDWQALAEGTATVTFSAFGFTDTATITVTEPFPRKTLQQWKEDHYNTEELLDSAITGNDVDRDGDGLDVLMEYLTGGDDQEYDLSFLPHLRITQPSEPEPGRKVYTVRVSNTLLGVTNFEIRSSLNLTQWTPFFDFNSDAIDLSDSRIVDFRDFGTFTEVDFAPPALGDPEFLHLEGSL
ncbi:MAG: hypothetical protein KDN20_02130 [Verrucomicrobiae bacterium]|nr:hypothetical protein [Verrucomicrobiae bacterium]